MIVIVVVVVPVVVIVVIVVVVIRDNTVNNSRASIFLSTQNCILTNLFNGQTYVGSILRLTKTSGLPKT